MKSRIMDFEHEKLAETIARFEENSKPLGYPLEDDQARFAELIFFAKGIDSIYLGLGTSS